MSRFQFVAENCATVEVKRLCQAVEIKRSSYYAWKTGAPARAKKATANAAPAAKVRAIQDPKTRADRANGAPRVTVELNDGLPPPGKPGTEERVNHKRVARVMREHSPAGPQLRRKVAPRSRRPTTPSSRISSTATSPPPRSPPATSGTSATCPAETAQGAHSSSTSPP